MNCHLISRVSGKAARTATVAAALFALAAPFSVAPAASASHAPLDYNVTLSCGTIDGLGLASFQSGWRWYQGGINGTVLATGSLSSGTCPPAGAGTITVTFSGTQPGKADTLFAGVEGGLGGCGGVTFGGPVSFTPGSPVSLSFNMVNTSPCSYQTNLSKTTVDAAFTLQS